MCTDLQPMHSSQTYTPMYAISSAWQPCLSIITTHLPVPHLLMTLPCPYRPQHISTHVACMLHVYYTHVCDLHTGAPPICLPCTHLSPSHASSPSPLTVVGPPSHSAEVGIAVVEQEFMLRAVYMAQQQGHQVTPINHPGGGWSVVEG